MGRSYNCLKLIRKILYGVVCKAFFGSAALVFLLWALFSLSLCWVFGCLFLCVGFCVFEEGVCGSSEEEQKLKENRRSKWLC